MKIDPSLITAAVASAEALINKTLSLDSAALHQLSQLDGAVIKVSITTLDTCVTLQPCNNRLVLSMNNDKFDESEVDVTIEGSPLSLARLIFEEDKDRLIRAGEISLVGNTEIAQQFQALMSGLNIDWESLLADIMGDIPAHFIGQKVRQGAAWGKQAQQSLTANIEEHLHEESRLLPTRIELQAQFADIDSLRLSAERLAARLAKLK